MLFLTFILLVLLEHELCENPDYNKMSHFAKISQDKYIYWNKDVLI